jgi:hypothetical protein
MLMSVPNRRQQLKPALLNLKRELIVPPTAMGYWFSFKNLPTDIHPPASHEE